MYNVAGVSNVQKIREYERCCWKGRQLTDLEGAKHMNDDADMCHDHDPHWMAQLQAQNLIAKLLRGMLSCHD